jgi:hypothetical protein
MLKWLSAHGDDDFVRFRSRGEIEFLRDFLLRAKVAGYDTRWLVSSLEKHDRLRRANIHTVEELRCALRELLPHVGRRREDDPVAVAEQNLIGKPLAGFFPTPRPVIRQMLDAADITPGMTVLEPSAGKGDILDALHAHFDGQLTVAAIEMNHSLQAVLEAKGHDVTFEDFLEHRHQYDRIVMNPPFERGQDIDHVMHAFDCLRTGGRLVSVMSEGPFFRSDKKAEGFRAWLDAVGGESEQLPEDAFRGLHAFRQTGCRTRMVVIKKEN